MKLHIFLSVVLLSASLQAATIVNDVTKLNPISVASVVEPQTTEEIKNIVKQNKGPVSIGGGRYSMGGQTATENAVQIDMRKFNKVLNLDVAKKKITVQAGIRWRDIQDEIDKHNLSIMIMQTYSNFTVGGSLSVNVHGRYVGAGPVINSVESFKIVLADGKDLVASRTENSEIFFSAIGGYGGMGVITEVTLNLVDNEKIRRESKTIPAAQYKKYFIDNIRDNKQAVLHNGDIFPPDYKTVKMETWVKTDQKLTNETRLVPRDAKYWLDPTVISSISWMPFGADIRAKVLEPLLNTDKEVVVWRNFEASYDVARLEPTTPRLLYTYVLQEYFVPVDQFDEFVPKMRKVFKKHDVNVLNVSIRHSPKDPGSYLAWANEEVFSFVVYYKQATTEKSKKNVARWTKEMIDQVLSVKGRYYLPYQIIATEDQFKKAYPRSSEFFALKKKYDPTNKFRNKLWDHYYTN